MYNPHEGLVSFYLTPEQHSLKDYKFNFKFDNSLFREACLAIDYPTSPDSAFINRLMRQSEKRDNEIMRARNQFADMVANNIRDMVLSIFEKNDTIDGYQREEYLERHK